MAEQAAVDLKDFVTDIADYPSPGVTFRDITPLLAEPRCFRQAVDRMTEWVQGLSSGIDVVAGVDARGFIFAGALAARLDCGFVPLRKKGKLPRDRISAEFRSEYSIETLEVHKDAFPPGARVLFHDDVIALGNCSSGSIEMLERLGGNVVGACFIIELSALGGRQKLAGHEVFSLVQY
jgi:adenine phosphoribosyltransferase